MNPSTNGMDWGAQNPPPTQPQYFPPWQFQDVPNLLAQDNHFFPNAPPPRPKLQCTICNEEYPADLVYCAPCRHNHCRDCIRRNALIALDSNPFRPARCCTVFSMSILRRWHALTPHQSALYSSKIEELTNPRSLLYCWERGCGTFIPIANRRRRVGQCPLCARKTCRLCRQKSHFGPCDETKLHQDSVAEDNMNYLAEENGWKRCPNCLRFVEKVGGCDHILCLCGQNFCYRCGESYPHLDRHDCPKRQERRR